MLLVIFTSVNNDESVDAFEGAIAELYPAAYTADPQESQTAAPLSSTTVDDLGNMVFSSVPVGEYILIVHLPGQEVIIEGINIEHG